MPTVQEVMLQALRELDGLVDGQLATGGTNATIVDTTLASVGYADDHFNGGTAFILQTTDGLAPVGESRPITDYVSGTQTLSVTPVFSAAAGAGDVYAVGTKRYPRGQVLGKLNEFLASLGRVPTEDATLITLADTKRYTIPLAAKDHLLQVWLAQSDVEPYDYELLTYWSLALSPATSAPAIKFPVQPRVGYKIRLVYLAQHAPIYADSDALSEYIGLDWAAAETALRLARWRLNQKGDDRESTVAMVNDLMNRAALAKARAPIWPQATPTFPYTAP